MKFKNRTPLESVIGNAIGAQYLYRYLRYPEDSPYWTESLLDDGDIEANPGPPSNNYHSDTTTTTIINDSRTQDTKAPIERLRMDVVGDISSPTVKDMSTVSRLGDNVEPFHYLFPKERLLSKISDICSVPQLFHKDTLSTTSDVISVSCDLAPDGSYAAYFSQMFKFFRGSTRVLFKFATSQLVSARF